MLRQAKGGVPTKKALFSLSGITTGTTRTFALPNTSSELAILAGPQTFSGNKTFSGSLTASGAVSITGTLTASGTVTVSAAAASIGTATTAATYGMGTGINPTGVTKTLNLGTGGASGSTTVVNNGSATAGAGGTTVVNTPTVTFTNAVTQVGMPQAILTAQLLGLGGATADSFNRLSMNTPAVLLNNAGAGIEATVNKAAAGNDAAFAFKTGFSARALIGLLGNDNFSFKVSPNGSTFFDAILVDRTSGQVELPQPTILPGLNAAPTPPPSGKTSVYARNRAGAPWIDVMRPSGRDFPLQPHFGVNRIANWSPSITTTTTTEGQVAHNLESKRRQYALVERARQLGWADIDVIDDDLGRSGSGVARPGFERLLAGICEGRVGSVVSIEASRLARNGRDWHTLLEFCGLVGTLIVDEDGVYDPRHPNDRLLLGMKGTMSEMELSILRQRSHEALRQKARRGELFMTVAIGYVRSGRDRVEQDPDRRIRVAIDLVFAKFDEMRSVRQVDLSRFGAAPLIA
jgi:DNA invertase Pin-like site-specific DNA recombinase